MREAMAAGLDRDDTVIRRRLRQKLEFLHEDAADTAAPTDAELQAWLDAHADAFRTEPRVSFRQVFVSTDQRGAVGGGGREVRPRAAGEGRHRGDGRQLGDATMLPPEFDGAARRDVGDVRRGLRRPHRRGRAGRVGGPDRLGLRAAPRAGAPAHAGRRCRRSPRSGRPWSGNTPRTAGRASSRPCTSACYPGTPSSSKGGSPRRRQARAVREALDFGRSLALLSSPSRAGPRSATSSVPATSSCARRSLPPTRCCGSGRPAARSRSASRP